MTLVTGGGTGLREATARHLAEPGNIAVQADVSDALAASFAFDTVETQLGAVPQLAVTCAGTAFNDLIEGLKNHSEFLSRRDSWQGSRGAILSANDPTALAHDFTHLTCETVQVSV